MSNQSTAQRLEIAEAKLAEITGQLTMASADLATVRAENATLKSNATAHEATISGLNTELVAIKGQLATAQAENATLAAKEQDIEKRATAKAAAVAAVVGATAPLPITATQGAGAPNASMSLAAFNALSTVEKNKFMAGGGKLS